MHRCSRSRTAPQNVFLAKTTEFLKLGHLVALYKVNEFSKMKEEIEHDMPSETRKKTIDVSSN